MIFWKVGTGSVHKSRKSGHSAFSCMKYYFPSWNISEKCLSIFWTFKFFGDHLAHDMFLKYFSRKILFSGKIFRKNIMCQMVAKKFKCPKYRQIFFRNISWWKLIFHAGKCTVPAFRGGVLDYEFPPFGKSSFR